MTINHGAIGAWSTGTGDRAVDYPTGISLGDLLVLYVFGRYNNGTVPQAPPGWSRPTAANNAGSSGTNGLDTGGTQSWIFYKVATGAESGTVTVPFSGNNAQAIMSRLTKDADRDWDVRGTQGVDVSAGTAYSATSNDTVDLQPGDWVLTNTTTPVDTATYSSKALTASSVTLGSHTADAADNGSTAGNDQRGGLYRAVVASGSGADTLTHTLTTSASVEGGSTTFVRVREVLRSTHVQSLTFETVNNSTATSLDVDNPGGVVDGDMLICDVAVVCPGTGTDMAITGPSGWTRVGAGVFDSGTPSLRLETWFRKWETGDPTTRAWSWGSASNAVAVISAHTGLADPPVDDATESEYGAQVASSTTRTTAALTTAGARVLRSVFSDRSGSNYSGETGDQRGVDSQASSTTIVVQETYAASSVSAVTETVTASAATSVAVSHYYALIPETATDLVVQDATQAQIADNVALGVDLTVQGAEHAQTSGTPTLTQLHELVAQAATHAQTADNVSLVVDLVVQAAAQAMTSDSPALTQQHELVVDSATQAQASGTPTLDQTHQLVVDDAHHGQNAELVQLSDPSQNVTPPRGLGRTGPDSGVTPPRDIP